MVRSEKTRQFIIERTAEIFNKKGYTGTYLSDLTTATGLTKGSIYGNFKDKNEVAVEAFRYNVNGVVKGMRKYLSTATDAPSRLKAFIDFYRYEHPVLFANGGCPLLNTATDADHMNPQLQKEVILAMNRLRNSIVDIINKGLENKELRSVDSSLFADKMVALIEGSMLMAKMYNNKEILLNNLRLLETEIDGLKRC